MGPQIIAMGGIPDEPDSLLLEKYLLEATGKKQPKITLLPTASGDSQESIDRFYDHFGKLEAVPSHLSLFRLTVSDRRDLLLEQDAIYVGGGSTHNMLLLWRDWGLVSILKEAWRNGIVLCGVSAGSICWFEQGVTDSLIPDRLVPLRGLGFLEGSNCPHYDSEPLRRPTCHDLLKRGFLKAGYAADDGVGLHFVGHRLHRVVSSRPEAKGYRVEAKSGVVIETKLETDFLNDEAHGRPKGHGSSNS